VGIAIFDAASLAKNSKATYEGLSSRSEHLRVRCDKETKAQEKALVAVCRDLRPDT